MLTLVVSLKSPKPKMHQRNLNFNHTVKKISIPDLQLMLYLFKSHPQETETKISICVSFSDVQEAKLKT